jgi:hypothetical protein
MAFSPPYDIDPNPMGDTVSEGIEKNDGNIFDIYANLNTLLSMIEAVPATGQQILDKLAPVDGIGSGLDAEYLGGRIYSEYGLATHTHDLATQSAPGFMAALINRNSMESKPMLKKIYNQTGIRPILRMIVLSGINQK